VQIAAQLSGSDERGWRVSLRSRGALDVAAVAERFGGGGHHNAAGCTIRADLATACASLEAALVALFDAA
jgi:phosphoesterase RecJ-like protein